MRHTFLSGDLARAWLAVTAASGKDKALPQLNRTVCIETFSTGVRLVATDSVLLLRTWIPASEDNEPEPLLEEDPKSVSVAMDLDGRGRNLAGYLLSLESRRDEDRDPPLETRFEAGITDRKAGALPGMQGKVVVFEHPGREVLQLPTYDGEYPPWRNVVTTFAAKRTDTISLSSELMSRLGSMCKLFPGQPLLWSFGGADKATSLHIANTHVRGLVMPQRVAEQITPEPEDEPEEE